MTSSPTAPLLFLTNTVYGESTYEETLWRGASRAASKVETPFCAVVGGQLVPREGGGGLKIPVLFQLAGHFRAQGAVFNGGTLQQGVSQRDLEDFILRFPQANKLVTALSLGQIPSVVVDNFAGMKAMVEYLATTLGRRRIAYVSGPRTNSEALERLRAYQEVMTQKNQADDGLVFEGNWTGPSGAAAVNHLLERRIDFDAVACANDLMALGVLEQLQSRGISIPEQVVVSGFDDIDAARYAVPQLTTVFQPIGEMGEKAVVALGQPTTGPSARLKVPARMVIRASAPSGSGAEGTLAGAGAPGGDRWLARLDGLAAQQPQGSWMARAVQWIREAWTSPGEPSSAGAGALLKASPGEDAEAFVALVHGLMAGLDAFVETPGQWKRATGILHLLTEVQRDHQSHANFLAAKKGESVTASLIAVNRILNRVSRLDLLENALAEGLGLCGIVTAYVVLVESQGDVPTGRCVAGVADARAVGALTRFQPFAITSIIDGGLPPGRNSQWLLLPLSFEDQDLGYIVFAEAPVSAFLYESVANLVSGVLHSVLLMERIKTAEVSAARRANRIDELVRPMIDALQTTGAAARQQGEVMASLVDSNTETARRLSGMDKPVTRMKEAVGQVMQLIGTIEDVSETISVIAINAAIAAARAGSDGKVFGVISAEIRRLSIETKANTAQITGVLDELGAHAQTFFEANGQTKTVFSRLESEIGQLMKSLQEIQTEMEGMNRQARLVLETMAEG